MKITTLIILAKRVYNLVARVVLETCKVGRPIYISMYIAMVSALTSLLLRQSAFCVLDNILTIKKNSHKPGPIVLAPV